MENWSRNYEIGGCEIDSLSNVKRMLRSSSVEKKMTAITCLTHALNYNPAIKDGLIKQDVITFLLEAMATTNWSLVTEIVKLLKLISHSEMMIADKHVVIVMEGIQRQAHNLAQLFFTSESASQALTAIFNLIKFLFERWCETESTATLPLSSMCLEESFISTIFTILSRLDQENTDIFMLVPSIATLAAFLQAKARCVHFFQKENYLLPCLGLCLTVIQSHQPMRCNEEWLQLANATCELSAATTRLCSELSAPDLSDIRSLIKNVSGDLLDVLLKQCVPRYREFVMPLDFLIQALLVYIQVGSDPQKLAHCLAEMGFLKLLLPFHRKKGTSEMLSEILANLANDLLDSSSWWDNDDGCSLVEHLLKGARVLPENVCDCFILLRQSCAPLTPDVPSHGAAQHFVIFLMYFHLTLDITSDWSSDEKEAMYPAVAEYVIRLLHEQDTVQPVLLKCVWLIIATYAINTEGNEANLEKASQSLGSKLDRFTLPELRTVYSHNSRLLCWAFYNSHFRVNLQRNIMTLWLTEEKSGDLIEDILKVRKLDAALPLLDVISEGNNATAEIAAGALSRAKVPDITEAIWSKLPDALSRCCQDRADLDFVCTGAGLLIWLCADQFVPAPSHLALRIGHSLAIVLGRKTFEKWPRLLSSSLKLVSLMFQHASATSDPRMLTTLFNDAFGVKEVVLASAADQNGEVSLSALDLLHCIQDCQNLFGISDCIGIIELNPKVFLGTLRTKIINVLEQFLRVLAKVLKEDNQGPLKLPLEENYARLYYMQLQQCWAKQINPEAKNNIWLCKLALLKKWSTVLADQPWTHMVIQQQMSVPFESVPNSSKEYFLLWLRVQEKENFSQGPCRREAPTLLSKSCAIIGTNLMQASVESKTTSLSKEIAQAVLDIDPWIPQDVRGSLKSIAEGSVKENVPRCDTFS